MHVAGVSSAEPSLSKLPPEQRTSCLELIQKVGTVNAARRLRVAPATIARAAAGLPLQRGTVSLLMQALDADRVAVSRVIDWIRTTPTLRESARAAALREVEAIAVAERSRVRCVNPLPKKGPNP